MDGFVDEHYDHRDMGNMTCESLARHLQEQLSILFKTRVKIELWETGKFSVSRRRKFAYKLAIFRNLT